jgi:hypothetical protein
VVEVKTSGNYVFIIFNKVAPEYGVCPIELKEKEYVKTVLAVCPAYELE